VTHKVTTRRFRQIIGVKPEQIEADERIHAAVWPKVLAIIRACNIRYINRDQPSPNNPVPRPSRYNERLWVAGKVNPYFIWPNINPFRPQPTMVAAATDVATFLAAAKGGPSLTRARQMVQQHRPT